MRKPRLILFFIAAALWANKDGAIPRHTGLKQPDGRPAPSESVCTECHSGPFALDRGPGSVTISVQPYRPGEKQRITVTVADPNQQRWGFQITARPANALTTQAGTFQAVDGNVRVTCDKEEVPAPCPAGMLQFPTHTLAGTRRGTRGSASFDVDWTAPASSGGDIVIAAAGNSANGNDLETGDNIYTKQVTISLASGGSPTPKIGAGGVVGAGASIPPVKQISPNGLISIYGQDFAAAGTLRSLTSADLVNGKLPTNLANVCVQIGSDSSSLGSMFFVSPGQINVQVPTLPVSGNIPVRVVTNCGTASENRSDAESVALQSATPEFFFFKLNVDGKNPIAAINAVTGARIGSADLIPGVTSPAKPGDFVTLYATGLGTTNPAFAAGVLPDKAASTVEKVAVALNSVVLADSDVLYAGVAPGFAGLYQINIKIPENTPDGDLAVSARIGSFTTPAGAFLTVKR